MLGVSIYPEHSSYDEMAQYLEVAYENNFRRVFTCLLSAGDDINEIKASYTKIINYATSLGYEVVLDVAPSVFDKLGVSYHDLSFFKELGATAIRLDEAYNGLIESQMSFNPQGLKIEINMSQDTHYLNTILDNMPRIENIIGCHNFYPQRYTGLNFEFFERASLRFKDANIRTCAFISSSSAKIGPWPLMDGLVTLEEHRDLKITTQAKHLFMLGYIDDVVIGNQYASVSELEALGKLDQHYPTFNVKVTDITPLEQTILLDEVHFNRGDINDYLIRSTQSRVKYRAESFHKHDACTIKHRGDVVIGNNDFMQYKGELQVIKKEILDQDLVRNIVARIDPEELFLLDLLKPWEKFKFNIIK